MPLTVATDKMKEYCHHQIDIAAKDGMEIKAIA